MVSVIKSAINHHDSRFMADFVTIVRVSIANASCPAFAPVSGHAYTPAPTRAYSLAAPAPAPAPAPALHLLLLLCLLLFLVLLLLL